LIKLEFERHMEVLFFCIRYSWDKSNAGKINKPGAKTCCIENKPKGNSSQNIINIIEDNTLSHFKKLLPSVPSLGVQLCPFGWFLTSESSVVLMPEYSYTSTSQSSAHTPLYHHFYS
jgi:hypothetical protein